MFSKSKSKGDKAKKRTSNPDTRPIGNLTQFGLLDVPNVSDFALKQDETEDDSALEAELLALTGGGGGDKQHNKKAKKLVAPGVLDQMVAECLKDYTDEELSDTDDQELLAELDELGYEDDDDNFTKSQHDDGPHTHNDISPTESEITGVESKKPAKPVPTIIRPSPFLAGPSIQSLLTERIAMYEEAIQNAMDIGEDSRAKRFKRGLATLNQMMKSVKSGKAINEEDIPPAVLVKTSRANSSVDVSELKRDNEKQLNKNLATDHVNNVLENKSLPATIPQNIVFGPKDEEHPTSSSDPSVLLRRQLEYKVAAVNAKKAGDLETALHYLKIVKQLSSMVDAARNGQEIDVNSIPFSPNTPTLHQGLTTDNTVTPRQTNIPVANMSTINEVLVKHDDEKTPASTPVAIGDSNQATSVPSIPTPISILDALEQRLQKYTQQRDKAKAEEDSRKERMNTRIMKQYQDAIKGHKAGKVVNFDELPTPPGYPPIPAGAPLPSIPSLSPGAVTVPTSSVSSSSLPSEKAPTSQSNKNVAPLEPKAHRQAPPVPGSVNSSDIKTNVRKAPQSRVERQLSLLQKRQDQFKEAALEAKKRGEIEQAKEYLRNFKGFDQLIMATTSGLPVDMNTVPVPPQEQISSFNTSIDFEIIDKNDCDIPPPTTPADIAIAFSKLENDLISQIKMCAQTREHFKAVGDVASSNRFENLIIHTKKDLDAIRVAMKRGDNPPKFHYENRSFTIIQCNTDLNDSDCEVTVMRGINYNVPNPKEIDTYVKLEFPYPTENPPQGKTELVKNSNCPVYDHKAIFSIDRKARALSRIFKRHSVKCQVVARGGWFHRDSVIGTAIVPLAELETKCTLHDSFDILDERKKMVGGKLEVKVKVRNPIISKQLEKVNEKWVVIDGY